MLDNYMNADTTSNDETETVDNTNEEVAPGDDTGGSVDISEAFQKEVNTLLDDATVEELRWLSSKASKMQYEMEAEERKKSEPEMDTEGMPSND